MAQTNNTILQLYYSTTGGAIPSGSNLSYGELALNVVDGKLYFKDSTNTVSILASVAGSAGTVQSVAVTAANGFNGTVSNATTNANITLSTTITGILKGNGTAMSAATAGTDYAPATSGSSILYGNGSGGFSNTTVGTNLSFAGGVLNGTGAPATVSTAILYGNGTGGFSDVTVASPLTFAGGILGLGAVTTGSDILKGDGAGGIANAVASVDYAPATTGTAILKGNSSGGFASAVASVDYAPATTGVAILYGNNAGGFSAVTVASPLTFTGGTLGLGALTTGASILYGDNTGGFSNVTIGTNLSFAGGTLNNTGAPATTGTTILKGNGSGGFSSAVANVDYVPPGANTSLTSVALTTGTITTAPASSTDIVNKAYADSIASGINYHAACTYATTVDLGSVTYSNGASGVGATLTNAGAQAALVIDGHTFTGTDVSNGVRVLVKNESNAAYNGAYVVTNQGSGATNWVLTRATDYNSVGTGVNKIDQGDLFLITSGTTNVNTSWIQQTAAPIVIGTTGIVFVQFSAIQIYTAGTGLTLSTNTFSITNVGTAGTYGSATQTPVLTTNAQGQVTGVTNTTITPAVGSITGFGTGTATALAVNVGSAGSFVTNGGALGTPSSGNLTNCTFPTLNQNTSGTASNVTGVVAIANGGTGQTTQQAAINILTGSQSSGKYLRSDGTNATLSNIQAADVPTLNQNTSGTASNVTGVVAIANGGSGQTTQQAALNAFAASVTNGYFLRGNGTNVLMSTIQATDVPTLNQNTTGSAGSVATTNWTVSQSGTKLYFAYNGVNKGSLDSSGNFVVTGNVTAFGTIT
jgi:hypothetical protein